MSSLEKGMIDNSIKELLLVCFDPGKTTGYSVVRATRRDRTVKLVPLESGEINMWEGTYAILDKWKPDVAIVEKFMLYPWLAKEQSFSSIPSAQVIGVITYQCSLLNIPLVLQSAAQGKNAEIPKYVKKDIAAGNHVLDSLSHIIKYIESTWGIRVK